MKTQTGYTFIEIMVTLGLAAILAVIALPSMSYMILNNKVTTKTNEFVRAFNYARSQAITDGKQVVVRQQTDLTVKSWGRGWEVVKVDSSPEEVMLDTEFDDDQIVVKLRSADLESVKFNSRGRVPQAQSAPLEFLICNEEHPQITVRIVAVRATGNVSVSNGDNEKCQ